MNNTLETIKTMYALLGGLIDIRDFAQECGPLCISVSDAKTLAVITERVGNRLDKLDPTETLRHQFESSPPYSA